MLSNRSLENVYCNRVILMLFTLIKFSSFSCSTFFNFELKILAILFVRITSFEPLNEISVDIYTFPFVNFCQLKKKNCFF